MTTETVQAPPPFDPVRYIRQQTRPAPRSAAEQGRGMVPSLLVLLGAGSPALIALGARAGVRFGASAVRGAYRVQPDWSIPPKDPTFGPLPSAQARSLIRGLDTTLLALVPLLLGLFLGYVSGVLLLAQAGFAAVCSCGDVQWDPDTFILWQSE